MSWMEFVVIVVALFSYLSVKAWVDARQREREAFYRADAVKKIVELQGNVPESLLDMLRQAVEQKHDPPASWNYNYNKEREAYYRNEMLKKVAMMPGGAVAVIEYLRHEDRRAAGRRGELSKLAGMITAAAGVGMMVFLRLLDNTRPIYLAGLIPLLVGVSLLVYAFGVVPAARAEN
jgi:hypothetical protein